jgi:hypothetical protein
MDLKRDRFGLAVVLFASLLFAAGVIAGAVRKAKRARITGQ